MTHRCSYTNSFLLTLKSANKNVPENLITITITPPQTSVNTKNMQTFTNNKWNRSNPVLPQADNSFSVARKKKMDKTVSDVIVGDMRSLLNRVTIENYDNNIKKELTDDFKLYKYSNDLEDDDKELFLKEVAKIFVRKAQSDHKFVNLYADMAKDVTYHIKDFGDILYEVCRESIPTAKYQVDKKLAYIGAMLLLTELRRNDIVTSSSIGAAFDRLMTAMDKCENEAIIDDDAKDQIELCIEIIGKVLPEYLNIESPEWLQKHLQKLKNMQTQKDKLRPRARFMLTDFFKNLNKQKILF